MEPFVSESQPTKKGGLMPFLVEFVKFSTGFATIIALSLVILQLVKAAGQ